MNNLGQSLNSANFTFCDPYHYIKLYIYSHMLTDIYILLPINKYIDYQLTTEKFI